MPVCPACAQSNPARARFCMSCGAALPVVETAPQLSRKTVTVVFCDVVGSTALGERLDPESVREVMTRFYREMRSVLEAHGGSVEKYIGDAVMAVFGVPVLHEDDALRAVQAAVGMRSAVEAIDDELERRFAMRLEIRIGVNTGEVVVGDPSAGQALVVGDAVNVAARLEQSAAPGEIVLGPVTASLVRQHVATEPTGPLELKGKGEPLIAHRLLEVRPARDAIGERADPPLVGRVRELEHLHDAFERARERRATVLTTVVGSAGVGKSRLAREFTASLADRATVLRGRCLPYGDGITFWPVTELVTQACAIADDASRDGGRSRIEAALAGAEDGALVARRIAGLTGFGDDVAGVQEAFWSVRRFLEWSARERPVIVVLDDLHWAEPTMLDLVEYLGGWSRGAPIHLVALARPELLEERSTWGAVASDASTLHLAPLDERDTERFVAQILGEVRGPVLARIEEAAGGNPLFLEEMVRMLEDEGVLRREGGRWLATRDIEDVHVPGSIQALLEARLDRLSTQERTVIRCAAVVGKEFWWGAVADLAPDDLRADVGTYLQALVRKDLIRPERSAIAGEDAFRFHHILLQEAAYRGTPKETRAELHERFADWIEANAGDRIVEAEPLIGYHLERAYRSRIELEAAGEREREIGARAARHLAAAATRAVERRDAPAAVDLLTRAIDLFGSAAPERGRLLLHLVEMRTEVGDLEGAEQTLAEASRVAAATGDQGLAAMATILGLDLLESTDPKRFTVDGIVEVERTIATLERLGDHAGVARAWRIVAGLNMGRSRYAAADAAFELAIDRARLAGAERDEIGALGGSIGSGAYGPAHVTEVERRCRELLERASGGGHDAPALRGLAEVRAMQGRFDEARDLAARSREILEDLGLRLRASFVSQTSGTIELLANDPVAAEREFAAGFDAMSAQGDLGGQATLAGMLAHALLEQGRVDDAEPWADRCAELAAEDDLASQALWRGARARVLASRGASDDALDLAREAVRIAETTDDVNMQADALVDLGDVETLTGSADGAFRAFEAALERYASKGNVAAAERIRPRVATRR